MSVFAGIDYDSEAIYTALIDEDTLQLVDHNKVTLKFRNDDSFQRTRRIRDLLPARGLWRATGVIAIGLEVPFTKQLNSLVALTRVQGAILACLPRDIDVLPFTPNRKTENRGWKQPTVGKTNATKDEVIAWATTNGAPTGLEGDFYDAFSIACATALLWQARHAAAA